MLIEQTNNIINLKFVNIFWKNEITVNVVCIQSISQIIISL